MLDAAADHSRRTMLRSVLIVTTAAPLLAACDLLDRKPDTPPPPDPLTEFYAQTVALAALYEGSPQTQIRDTHLAHVAALAAIMKPAPSGSPAPSASLSASPGQGDLRQAEQKAHEAAIKAFVSAPQERTTLLGEITAARACHLEVLP